MATLSGLVGLLATDKIKGWSICLWQKVVASGPFWASLTLQDWLLAITLAGLAVYAIATMRAPRRPISVLRTHVRIVVDEKEPHRTTVHRRQHLRANRKGANAYFTRISPSRNGTVPEVSGFVRFFGRFDGNCSDQLKKDGNPNTGWECQHKFSPELPFLEVSRIVPEFLLRFDPDDHLPVFLSRLIVLRDFEVKYVDNPADEEFSYRLEADRYPQRRIRVDLQFPSGTLSRINGLRDRVHAEVRQAYAVADINIDWDAVLDRATVRVDRLESAVLQIRWPNLAKLTGSGSTLSG